MRDFIADLHLAWRVWFRPQQWVIDLCYWIIDKVAWHEDPPHPEAVEKAKHQTHYFIIKITYDPEIKSYVAEFQGVEGIFQTPYTQGNDLPDALYMAGDLGRINLEYLMAQNQYPCKPSGVWEYDTNTGELKQ